MSKEIKTAIEIKATPEKVWQVLTNFEAYARWNPFIKSISGKKEVGEKLATEMHLGNRKPMKFKPVILKYEQNQEFRWLGSMGIKGIFDGEHYFKIKPMANGAVRFEHGENFKGILIGFMPKVFVDTNLAFEQMNEALKKECETK